MADGFVESLFSACAEAIGPLIGVEIDVSNVTLGESGDPPEGNNAVLPLQVEAEADEVGNLELIGALHGIAALARRMEGDEEPDKERELSDSERNAVGELFGVAGGALDTQLRAHRSGVLMCKPLDWWQSDEAPAFAEGDYSLVSATFTVPSGPSIQFWLRLPAVLLASNDVAEVPVEPGRGIVVGLDNETASALEAALSKLGLEVERVDIDGAVEAAAGAAVLLMGNDSDALARCRSLRLDNETWHIPIVVCIAEPTREDVLVSAAAGANEVLCLPAEESSIHAVVAAARH